MKTVEVVSILTSDNKTKYKALRAAGFDTEVTDNNRLILIDKRVRNSDDYCEMCYYDINEVLKTVSDYIVKAGYRIKAA